MTPNDIDATIHMNNQAQRPDPQGAKDVPAALPHRDDVRGQAYGAVSEGAQSRQSPYAAAMGSPDTHIGATQPIAIRKGLFDGISVAQVIAASAAAATSMLLASKIGIAGSVIGAAVSSMVTVVCSQMYRNALDASAQKLKAKQAYNAYVHGTAHDASGQQDPTSAGAQGSARPNTVLTARIAPTKLQARAAAERSAAKRKVAVASALIAALAVALSAGAIMLSTAGEGLGAKTSPIFHSAAPAPEQETNPADELASTNQPDETTPQNSPDANGAGATEPSNPGDTQEPTDENAGATAPEAPQSPDNTQGGGSSSDANGDAPASSGDAGAPAQGQGNTAKPGNGGQGTSPASA